MKRLQETPAVGSRKKHALSIQARITQEVLVPLDRLLHDRVDSDVLDRLWQRLVERVK